MFAKRTYIIWFITFLLIITLTTLGLSLFRKAVGHEIVPVQVQKNSQIYKENQQEGSTGWKSPALIKSKQDLEQEEEQYEQTHKNGASGVAAADPNAWVNNRVIEGYADKTSINKGSSIKFFVTTSKSTFKIEVYRMGWYNGTGARLMKTVTNLTGKKQPIPTPQPGSGLIESKWSSSYTLSTSTTWQSGAYTAKLTASDGSVGYIVFVVRDDSASADILYVLPVTTYQAYNNWGGKSLYDFNSVDGRAYKVSYDRPYVSGEGTGGFFDSDYNTIRWLEKNGYSLTYATSVDLHGSSSIMNNRKVFLSNGHDEYWSRGMRDQVVNARDAGKDLVFLGANDMYWQVRFESSTSGSTNRVQVCYKQDYLDPYTDTNPSLATVNWRSWPVNQPENEVLGSMYESDFEWGTSFPWIVQNAFHWIYAGTNVKDGDAIDGLVGYEYDKVFDNGYTPTGTAVLSASPVVDGHGMSSIANGTLYTAKSQARVYNAGTIYWPWKLDDNEFTSRGADARVQRMTANILQAMINNTNVSTSPSITPSVTISPTAAPTVTPMQPTPTVTNTPPSGATAPVYSEALGTGWVDWSWSSQNTLQDTTKPYTGTKNILWKPTSGWAGLFLHTDSGFDTTGYTALSFAVQASASQKLGIQLYDTTGIGTTKDIAQYGSGDPDASGYKVYTIPLTDIGGNNKKLSGFHVQALSDTPVSSIYVDEIVFVKAITSVTPSPTGIASPTPIKPTVTPIPSPTGAVTPSPTVAPVARLTIYDDVLAQGWQSWSWSTLADFANTNPVIQGIRSISYIATEAWSGLDLHNPTGVSTVGYTTLHFSLQASQPGQSYGIYLEDATGKSLQYALGLTNYGGDPIVGAWKTFDIPLTSLNASNKTISGIVIHEWTGKAQPAVYIDQIELR
jgi:hypothetical protein